MKIKILFDKEAISDKFATGWGVAYLLGNNVLLDTGEKFEYLKKNLEIMGLDMAAINKVVITHEHWDHSNGLWGLLELNKGIKVYVCPKFHKDFKQKIKDAGAELVEVTAGLEIDKDIYSSGELVSSYKGELVTEQALVIGSQGNPTIVGGCFHAGVLNTIEKVRFTRKDNKINISALVGGLHLMDKEKRFVEYIVSQIVPVCDKVYPGHCAGHDAIEIFRDKYKDNCVPLKVGMEIEV